MRSAPITKPVQNLVDHRSIDVARVLLREAVFLAGEPVDVDAALDGVPEDAPPRAGVPAHPEPALALLVELCERGEIHSGDFSQSQFKIGGRRDSRNLSTQLEG